MRHLRESLPMADKNDIHPLNISGEFFNDLSCIDCGLCPELAPNNFRRDDEGGYSYVFKQPTDSTEHEAMSQAVADCPSESIGQKTTPQQSNFG